MTRARATLAKLPRVRRSFSTVMRDRAHFSARLADWGLWSQIMFYYQPLGYACLSAIALQAVLCLLGFPASTTGLSNRFVGIVGHVSWRSQGMCPGEAI
jgi:hypothetical protein